MPDSVLRFGTDIDLSTFDEQIDNLRSGLTNTAEETRRAMKTAQKAVDDLERSYRMYGQSAQKAMAAGRGQDAPAIFFLTEAKKRAEEAVNAYEQLTAAQEAAAAGGAHTVTQLQATSGAVRELSGALPIRAFENFVSTTLGLGPALQAAFPIFGAIAMGEVLVDLGKKVVDLYDHFLTLKVATQDVSKGLAENAQKIGKAWSETTQIIHATGMRDNPLGTIRTDLDDATRALQTFQGRARAAQKDLSDLQAIKASGNYLGYGTNPEENALAIRGHQAEVDFENARVAQAQARVNDLMSQEKKQEDKGPKEKKGADPQIQALRDLEIGLRSAQQTAEITSQQEAEYWQSNLQLFKDGSSQYLTVLDKLSDARKRAASEFGRDVLKMVADGQREVDEEQKVSEALEATNAKITRSQQEATKALETFNAEITKRKGIETQSEASLAQFTIAQSRSLGIISDTSAAMQEAALHAQAYKERIAELQTQLAAINAENPTDQAGVNDQELRGQRVQTQITQLRGQAGITSAQDQGRIAQSMSAPYLQAFQTINQGFLQVQQQMILGTQSISRDFANMGANLVASGAAWVEQWLAKQAAAYISDHFLHLASETAKTADTTASTAVTTSTVVAANVAQASSYAAVAAAAAAASVAMTPIVGPALAPAAAAATYASTVAYAGLAAFETGGIIPNTGIAMVHEGEAVLPKPLTNFLMNSAVSNDNSSRVSSTMNIKGMDNRSFRQMLNRHSDQVVASMQRGMRSKGYS